jgi:hypothetical protein
MSDTTTTTQLTAAEAAAEDANRKQIAAGLAARTAKFNETAPAVVAVEEPKQKPSLAGLLRQIGTPREMTRAARTAAHDALARVLPTGAALLARYDAVKAAIGDRAQDFAAIPLPMHGNQLPPIMQAIPPKVHPNQDYAWNHFAIKTLVNAAREISTTLASDTYRAFTALTDVMRKFESGQIREYMGDDPSKYDRFTSIPDIGTALRTYEAALPTFKNVVDALEANAAIVERNEKLIAEDLATIFNVQPIEQVPQQTIALHQKLPVEQPRSYATDFGDPREHAIAEPDTVKIEAVDGGAHITTVRRRAE